jgi:hypothetical protein
MGCAAFRVARNLELMIEYQISNVCLRLTIILLGRASMAIKKENWNLFCDRVTKAPL